MFAISVMTSIDCPPQRVWDFLVDVRTWWLPSNPEHESLVILSPDARIALGTMLRIRERIAGIPGEATGVVTEFVPGERATWEARARYRLFGTHFTVEEGVTWSVRPSPGGTELRAEVWALFPKSLRGRWLEWLFVHVLRGRDKDREHAQTELDYIRAELERQRDAAWN